MHHDSDVESSRPRRPLPKHRTKVENTDWYRVSVEKGDCLYEAFAPLENIYAERYPEVYVSDLLEKSPKSFQEEVARKLIHKLGLRMRLVRDEGGPPAGMVVCRICEGSGFTPGRATEESPEEHGHDSNVAVLPGTESNPSKGKKRARSEELDIDAEGTHGISTDDAETSGRRVRPRLAASSESAGGPSTSMHSSPLGGPSRRTDLLDFDGDTATRKVAPWTPGPSKPSSTLKRRFPRPQPKTLRPENEVPPPETTMEHTSTKPALCPPPHASSTKRLEPPVRGPASDTAATVATPKRKRAESNDASSEIAGSSSALSTPARGGRPWVPVTPLSPEHAPRRKRLRTRSVTPFEASEDVPAAEE